MAKVKIKLENHYCPLRKVTNSDLCIACGACINICPNNNIQPIYNQQHGSMEVAIINPNLCSACSKRCIKVCPSVKIDFTDTHNEKSQDDIRQSPIINIHTAYSKTFRDDGVSGSGGIARSIIFDSLNQGIPVVCLTGNDSEYKAQALISTEDMIRIPASIYHSVDFTDAIKEILSLSSPCVLVATPCQLAGIINYFKNAGMLFRDHFALTVGLFCGWMYSWRAIEAFAGLKKIREPIKNVQYRGGDKYGRLRIKTDESEYDYSRGREGNRSELLDYRTCFNHSTTRLRCRLCQDHMNLLADIAIGDAWLTRKQNEKTSLVVTRTQVGDAALKRLITEGDIVVENADFKDIIKSQSRDLVYGITARKLRVILLNKLPVLPNFIFGDRSDIRPNLIDRSKLRFELYLRNLMSKGLYRKCRRLQALCSIPRLMISGKRKGRP